MKITIAAISGKVIIAGEGGLRFAVTPQVARQLAEALPRFASLAETALPDAPVDPEFLENMAHHIESLGFQWRDSYKGQGFWVSPTGEVHTPLGEKSAITSALYWQLAEVVHTATAG